MKVEKKKRDVKTNYHETTTRLILLHPISEHKAGRKLGFKIPKWSKHAG